MTTNYNIFTTKGAAVNYHSRGVPFYHTWFMKNKLMMDNYYNDLIMSYETLHKTNKYRNQVFT